jgi:hypothetical protein
MIASRSCLLKPVEDLLERLDVAFGSHEARSPLHSRGNPIAYRGTKQDQSPIVTTSARDVPAVEAIRPAVLNRRAFALSLWPCR